ncbi:MAG: riboflavin biosynthesis protein RibF [Desulfobulbus propionicus]|nr:MAG: riboflavin biosynthesis protein RibF [Desulfobulbus propionicus]
MQILRSLDDIAAPFEQACVTIGNFDGVHLGHQRLFEEVVSRAHQMGGTSVAVTFAPHPLKILRPGGVRLISSTSQKIELIRRAGLDVLVIIPFNRIFAEMPAAQFVDEVLLRRLGIRHLVVGFDYAFGREREGDIDFLVQQGAAKGFPVTVIHAHVVEGTLVSSTKIRELVVAGRMRDVRRLLGRWYQIRGVVSRGKQRGGRMLGFPTANLQLSEEDLCPKTGVYVTQVIYDGRQYGGVANIGYNPTFADTALVAETHIFDFNRDIYGKSLHIDLLRHLRSETVFASTEDLVVQIRKDIEVAHKVLEEARQRQLLDYHPENLSDDA